MLFRLPTIVLLLCLTVVIFGSVVVGLLLGRRHQQRRDVVSESFGVLQGALLGFMALILAFGLSLAIGRYEARRVAIVDDANTIGTTYLRAQTLAEPMRSKSLPLLVRYADLEVRLTHEVPGSDSAKRNIAAGAALQRPLWSLSAQATRAQPQATAPRLYEESLNEMIDQQTTRVAGLGNRVPTEVLVLEVTGAAIALLLMGLHVGVLGRSVIPPLLAAGLVTMLLFVTFDLDRPTRGFIELSDKPLVAVRASMDLPPAAGP